jgi:hypothetical protein
VGFTALSTSRRESAEFTVLKNALDKVTVDCTFG